MTSEQKQLERIREHLAQRKAEAQPLPSTEIYITHVDFLLSLIKEQEAGHDPEIERIAIAGIQEGLRQRDERAVTSMRSACVEKLRERANRYQVLANNSLPNDQTAARTAAAAAALNSAADELESLSIEKLKE